MKRENFLGAWHLQSWAVTLGSKVSYPFGEDARGLLMYTDDGHMSAVINGSDELSIPADSMRNLAKEKKARLFDNCFTYAGTWRLDNQGVVHHVHYSHNPNFIGTEQFRDAEFENNILTLSANEEIAGKGTRLHKLIWKKSCA